MRASDRFHSPTPEDIMEYLDGEGTAASRSDIAAHLVSCAQCQAVAAGQRGLSERAQAWQVPPAPASMTAPAAPGNPLARLRHLRPRTRWLLAALPAAAAVLLVVSMNQGAHKLAIAPGAQADYASLSVPRASAAVPEAGQSGVLGGVVGGLASAPPPPPPVRAAGQMPPRAPAIIRTALLRIVMKDFGAVRASVESLVAQSHGFIDRMTVTGDTSAARTLNATLRVPADRMADTLARLRGMGQVTEDTQGSQDVTDQVVDLDARLASARATEQRLTELLANRTGRLSDVLEVERELTRVRLDIERLDAQKTNLGRRVSYATIDITISEERKAGLDGPLSLATRLRVAAADGVEAALDSIAFAILLVLQAGPVLIVWGLVAAALWLLLRRRVRFGIHDPR